MYNPFIGIVNQVLPEPQAALLNGILFGIRAQLPRELYEGLITTGTVHIIALSGQNIAILARILSEVTLIFGRKVSSLMTLAGVVGFVAFVGGEPTIIRAAIMGSLSLLAVYFGRQSWSLLSLVLAASTMLLVNPSWIIDLSFQLSFLATLGIILFVSTGSSQKRGGWAEALREIKINLRTTLAAQIFTTPLIFLYFRRISLIAPLTNLLIAPMIGPIMGAGILLSLLGWLYLPLGILLGWLVWVPLTFILSVVDLAKRIPYAAISY